METQVDFITGKPVPNVGAEANRQAIEKILIDEKGYAKDDIEIDVPIALTLKNETYRSRVDVVVNVDGKRFMAIKCAPGSLGSREREILAAARLLEAYQIPYSIATDGQTAMVIDTVTGKKLGEGLAFIPSKKQAMEILSTLKPIPYPAERLERESLIFRSYDSMNVNRIIL